MHDADYKLNEAQRRRAHDRANFFEFLVRLIVQLHADPNAIDGAVAEIRAASNQVSESLDATDQALIDRVTAIVWEPRAAATQEQANMTAEQFEQLDQRFAVFETRVGDIHDELTGLKNLINALIDRLGRPIPRTYEGDRD